MHASQVAVYRPAKPTRPVTLGRAYDLAACKTVADECVHSGEAVALGVGDVRVGGERFGEVDWGCRR